MCLCQTVKDCHSSIIEDKMQNQYWMFALYFQLFKNCLKHCIFLSNSDNFTIFDMPKFEKTLCFKPHPCDLKFVTLDSFALDTGHIIHLLSSSMCHPLWLLLLQFGRSRAFEYLQVYIGCLHLQKPIDRRNMDFQIFVHTNTFHNTPS